MMITSSIRYRTLFVRCFGKFKSKRSKSYSIGYVSIEENDINTNIVIFSLIGKMVNKEQYTKILGE